MVDVKILVVEDDAIEAMDIKRTLESFGYSVPYVASRGEEAVEKALEIMPDLILMDIILKGEHNGIEAASKIKKLNIPIIYLTAHSEESTIQKAKLTGPYGYIIKPFEVTELKYAIELAIYKNTLEKTLRESEERYRMLFENSQVSTAITSMDGKVITANNTFFEMVGVKPENIEQIDLNTMYHDVNQRNTIIETLKKGGIVKEFEVDLLRADGQPYTNSINVNLIRYHDEDAMLVTAIDISQRKKAEKSLKVSEEWYKSLYFSMNEGMAIHKVIYDENQIPVDYEITDVNPAYEKILGIKREEVLGKRATESYGAGKAPYLDIYSEVADKGVPTQFETYFEPMDKQFKISVFSPSKGVFASIFEDVTGAVKAKKALEESEEKYRLISENTADLIWVLDLDSEKFTYVSPSVNNYYGIAQEEFLKRSLKEVATSETYKFLKEVLPQRIEALLSGDESARVKTYRFHKFDEDGNIQYSETVDTLLTDEEGNVTHVMGVTRDITERKKFESALKESEERFKTVADFTYNWEYWIDPDGNFIYVSPSCERITGYTSDEFVQDPSLFVRITHPDDLEIIEKHFPDVAKSDKPSENIQFRIITKQGEKKWIGHVCQPVCNDKGEFMGRRASNRDITKRKKIENNLTESEERMRLTLEATQIGLWDWDVKNDLWYTSPVYYSMLGYEPQTGPADRNEWMERLHPDDRGMVIEKIDRVLFQNFDSYEYEARMLHADGKYRWLSVKGFRIECDQNQKATRILGIRSDITEYKKVEEQLRDSLKEKEVLLKEIHHRVKNNMQIIISLLNLQKEFVEDEEANNVLKESQNRVKSMAMVHERLYQSQDIARINIQEYIERLVVDLFYSYDIPREQVASVIEVDDLSLNIETAVPCGLIISELVSNSLKYAFTQEKSGQLKVSLKRVDELFELIIEDNGIGFPEIFDFKNTETLGLQLVNILVKQIDGEIKLDQSQGTEFKIIFKELDYTERLDLNGSI